MALAQGAVAGLHLERHEAIAGGPKMDIAAATYFGDRSPEEFVGIGETRDGDVVVCGNSWGPTFPAVEALSVIGPDRPWPAPLYPPGMERDRKGRFQSPPSTNPNRTGFFLT
jgi:hypothetical protein